MSFTSVKAQRLWPLVGAAAFAVATYLIWRALRDYSLREIMASLELISWRHLGLGALFTALSYLSLTGFDALAVRYTGRDLPYRKIAFASFVSLSIGHTLGFAAFSSGAVRFRFYTAWGLSPGDVGRIILFCGLTVAVGLATLGGIGMLAQPELTARMLRLQPSVVVALGCALIALTVGYLIAAATIRGEVHLWRFHLPMPPLKLALGQVVIGTCNFAMVAGALHQMLSAVADVGYFQVAALYAAANGAAIVSHVPGGLGVIEAVVLSLMPGARVVGALVAFRVVYFLIPLAIGSTLFAAFELVRRVRRGSFARSP